MRLEIVLSGHARRAPDRPAVICGPERITYRELVERADRLAAALADLGVRSGDRVVLYLPNGIAFVELLFATLALGAVAVPANTRLTAHELKHICGDATPKAFCFHQESRGVAAELAPLLGAARLVVCGAAPGAVSFDDLVATPARHQPPLAMTSDDAMIMYTSGTTGRPKGAVVTHSNLVTQHGLMNAVEWGLTADDRFLVTTPLAHRTGCARLANALTLGGTAVVLAKFEPQLALDAIEREQLTVAGMVPTVCRMLLPAIEADRQKCASLRRIVVTGEAFPVDLKRRLIALLPQVRLVSFFAMTEAGSITSLSHEEQFTHPESVGRPTPGVEILILDADREPLPAGEIGELAVRAGAPGQFTVMRGYFNRPDETAAAFHEGFLLTGDLARQDSDGYVFIVDRKKDMILSGGFNIYSKEVEQALITHPGVADAAVVGVPDAIYGEAVAAFIEPASGASPRPEALIEHCRRQLASYKKPKYVFITATMPRNGVGKVLKTDLRTEALRLVDAARSVGHASP